MAHIEPATAGFTIPEMLGLGQRRSADLLAHVLAARNWLSLSHDRPSPLKEHKPYRQINYCGSIATEMGSPRDVRLSPNSGGIADIPALRVCARLGHVRLLLS